MTTDKNPEPNGQDEPESIQSKGGKARDKALTDEQKKEIARKAAEARWAGRTMKATHKGNFKDEFGFDVECYVMDDARKTAVISQRGMGRALGLAEGGREFPRFLNTKAMRQHAGGELSDKLSQPIKFQYVKGGGGDIHGYDATILIDLCKAIIRADDAGAFPKRGSRVVSQAHVILSASAKAGIQNLVYALAGYNPTASEVIAAFKLYVQEEAKKYEKEFPPELYAEWYRLYEIPVLERGKPWTFKHLTVKHIYRPLAKSDGQILALTRALKANDGDRSKKLFQFLSDVGTRALRFQLGRVYQMASEAKNQSEYEAKITQTFGGQPDLPGF